MSDTMLLGVLKMPDDLFWKHETMTRLQHNQVRLQAADELEKRAEEITRLRERVEELEKTRADIREQVYSEIGEAQSSAYENKYFKTGEDLEELLDLLQTNEKDRLNKQSQSAQGE